MNCVIHKSNHTSDRIKPIKWNDYSWKDSDILALLQRNSCGEYKTNLPVHVIPAQWDLHHFFKSHPTGLICHLLLFCKASDLIPSAQNLRCPFSLLMHVKSRKCSILIPLHPIPKELAECMSNAVQSFKEVVIVSFYAICINGFCRFMIYQVLIDWVQKVMKVWHWMQLVGVWRHAKITSSSEIRLLNPISFYLAPGDWWTFC